MSKQKEIISIIFHSIAHTFLDGLFPRRCLGCSCYDTFLCDSCLTRIPRRIPATFFVANSSNYPSSLDSLTSATFFHVPIVSLLIHSWKYQFLKDLSVPLTKLLNEATERTNVPLPDIITSVPLHPKRLRERGFNQSDILAQRLTTHINSFFPVTVYLSTLDKVRYTQPQSKQVNRKARLSNLTEAFSLKKNLESRLKDKTIWLIDDVTTTGTTLTECAKILKAHGAKEVHGFVIAH